MDTHKKIDVAGLQISAITKREFLDQVTDRINRKERTFVITPYSEFLFAALQDDHIKKMLNELGLCHC